MGRAIIIDDADFSALNLGKVTFKREAIELQSLSIIGASTINESGTYQYSVVFTPTDTTQTNLVWTLATLSTTISDYVSIDSATGTVFIKDGAPNGLFFVRATSLDNSDIYVDKEVIMNIEQVIALQSLEIDAPDTIPNTGTHICTVKYSPSDTTQKGVVWTTSTPNNSVFSLYESPSYDGAGVLTVIDVSNRVPIVIRATSLVNSDIYVEKTIIIGDTSVEDPTLSPTLFMPLTANGNDTVSGLVPDVTTTDFSDDGALFDNNTQDLIWFKDVHFTPNAFSCEIKLTQIDSLASSSYHFITYCYQMGDGGDTTGGPDVHCLNLWFKFSGQRVIQFGYSFSDQRAPSTNKDVFFDHSHSVDPDATFKIAIGRCNDNGITKTALCINGTVVGETLERPLYSPEGACSLVIGNNWRGAFNNGTRALGGYIKNARYFENPLTLDELKSLTE